MGNMCTQHLRLSFLLCKKIYMHIAAVALTEHNHYIAIEEQVKTNSLNDSSV